MNFLLSNYLVGHVFSVIGMLLVLVLLSRMLREHRQPGSTAAWFIVMVAMPFIGIPLYLIIGGRKQRGIIHKKAFTLNGNQNEFFPVREHNTIKLLNSGSAAYTTLQELIDQAQTSVAISTYIIGNDPIGRNILDLLIKKANAGVKVYVLLDGVGSFWAPHRQIRKLIAAGGKVEKYLPLLSLPFKGRANLRNHRKLLIVDGQRGVIGGMNLAQNYLGTSDRTWKDLSFLVIGEAVQDFARIFESDWIFASAENITLASTGSKSFVDCRSALHVIPSGPDVNRDLLYEKILDCIFRAESKIEIATPYFIPDEILMKALLIAASKGVKISLCIPKRSNHPIVDFVRETYLIDLHAAGIKINLYLPTMLHAKILIIDDATLITGSANMDIRSMLLNYEVAIISKDIELLNSISMWWQGVIRDTEAFQPRNSPIRETLQGFGRVFAPLL